MIGRAIDFAYGLMGVGHLLRRNAELEVENVRLREQVLGELGELTGRVTEIEKAVDDVETLVKEFTVGPDKPDAGETYPEDPRGGRRASS
jgi:hypothetical protein